MPIEIYLSGRKAKSLTQPGPFTTAGEVADATDQFIELVDRSLSLAAYRAFQVMTDEPFDADAREVASLVSVHSHEALSEARRLGVGLAKGLTKHECDPSAILFVADCTGIDGPDDIRPQWRGMKVALQRDALRLRQPATNQPEEWSRPMSKGEIARRVRDCRTARPRDIHPILAQCKCRKAGSGWQIRLDLLNDPSAAARLQQNRWP